MANINVKWIQTRLISIFEEAQNLGFDLRKFEQLNNDTQNSVKKATVSLVYKKIRETWDRDVQNNTNKSEFIEIKQGIYVISIGHGFGVNYKNGCSEVLYIGRGIISNRIRLHLQNWIFDMSRSLRDVTFKFSMEELNDGRSPDAFKDFEHWLLERFNDKYSEKPLLNKISGREGKRSHSFTGNCNAPLDNRGKKFLWEIRPTEKNQWFKPVADS